MYMCSAILGSLAEHSKLVIHLKFLTWLQFSSQHKFELNNFEFSTDCCIYEGRVYKNYDTIYNTTDGMGGCITAICYNSTVVRINEPCSTTAPSTTFHFSTTSPVTSRTTPTTVETTTGTFYYYT